MRTNPPPQIIRLAESAIHLFRWPGAASSQISTPAVDPDHPVLAGVLLQGYDFTRKPVGRF